MCRRLVDLGRAAAAALVPQRPGIADARHDEAIRHAVEIVAIAVEPAQRPERPRAPEEAVRVSEPLAGQRTSDRPKKDDARKVVVREGGMTDVSAEQKLRRCLTAEGHLAGRKRAVIEA